MAAACLLLMAGWMAQGQQLKNLSPCLGDMQSRQRNVMIIKINASGKIMVDGVIGRVEEMRSMAAEFMSNPHNKASLPEKVSTEVEGLGRCMVSKGAIVVRCDGNAPPEAYDELVQVLLDAMLDLRDAFSVRHYGKRFRTLSQEQKQAVRKAIPRRLYDDCLGLEVVPDDTVEMRNEL